MATILLTEQFQRISTIPLNYGELRTYAKLSKQSVQYNNSTYILEARYYAAQTVNIGSSTLILDGFNKALGYTTFSSGETKIQEVTRTVTHNEDGSCPVINVKTEWYASFGGSGTANQDITCPKIDRVARTNDFTGRDVEGIFKVDYTKYVDSFSYKLRISIPDVQRLMLIDDYVSNDDVTLDTASVDYIKNYMNTNHRSTVTIGMRVETWDGTTRISEGNEIKYTCSFVNAEPTFTFSYEETNTKVSTVMGSTTAEYIVENASVLSIEVIPTALKGATIESVRLVSGETVQTKTSSPYIFSQKMLSDSFGIFVTDSRGLSRGEVIHLNLLNYTPVKINSFSFKRENPTSSNIEVGLDSNYLQATYNQIPNTPLVQWKLEESGTLNTIPSTEYSIDTTSNKLKLNNSVLTNALNYRNKGTFYIYVSDLFTSANDSMEVIKGIPTFDVGEHDLCINGSLYLADTDRDNKVNIDELINGVILWENSDPTSSFGAQTIYLSDNFSNYGYYEIIFRQLTTTDRTFSTGKIIVGTATILNFFASNFLYRVVDSVGANSITFNSAYSNNSIENRAIIPLKVIGYKVR